MGIVQKQENWVPYELTPRDVKRGVFACEQLLESQRRKAFLHRNMTGDENGLIAITPSAENHGDIAVVLSPRRPNRIFTTPK